MARIRTIKPEFWKHEDLSELPPEAHMLAAALLNYADDQGYFNANPKLIKAECCPLRDDSMSTQGALQALAKIGYIQLGTGSDGKRYGLIVKFTQHQSISRPSASKIANKSITWDDSVSTHGVVTEDSTAEQGTGNRERNREQGTGKGPSDESLDSGGGDSSNRDLPAESPPDPVVILIPLVDGSEHGVTKSDVAEYAETFPAIDVAQSLRNCRAWNIANAKNRKTASGVKRHIASWLTRDQNSAPPAKAVNGSRWNAGGGYTRNEGAARQAAAELWEEMSHEQG